MKPRKYRLRLQFFNHLIDVIFRNHKRRYHTKNVASGGNHKKSVLNRAVNDFSDRTARYDKALHKAFSTACCEAVIFFHQFVQLFLQIRSRLCYMLYDMLFLIAFKYSIDSRAGQRVSAVCRSVVSRNERMLCRLFIQHEGADRNAAAKCFCTRHDIRLYAVILPCEQFSRSSHTALDLVENQQDVVLVTQIAHAL